MGLYACLLCLDRYELTTARLGGTYAPCEICGPLKSDWSVKWTNFTWDITRLAEPVGEQILNYVTWASEVGGRGVASEDQVRRAFL